MNLDEYLSNNFDEILDNPDKYVGTNNNNIGNNKNKIKSKKHVCINEFANNVNVIQDNCDLINFKNFDNLEDLDEREYLEYNQEFYDNSNEYYNVLCDDDDADYENANCNNANCDNVNYDNANSDTNNNTNLNNLDHLDDNSSFHFINKENDVNEEPNEDDCEDYIIDELYEKMHKSFELAKLNELKETKDIFEYSNNKSIRELIDKANLIYESNEHNNSDNNNRDNNKYNNIDGVDDIDRDDEGYYFINLMNVFTKYYNNKYDKLEHFFSNIDDMERGVSNQMSIFFDAITEFKMYCDQMNITTEEAMKHLYTESEPEKISKMFETWDKQIYMFELDELKLFSPSLIICLNYIYEKNILNSDWNIYNLRDND